MSTSGTHQVLHQEIGETTQIGEPGLMQNKTNCSVAEEKVK